MKTLSSLVLLLTFLLVLIYAGMTLGYRTGAVDLGLVFQTMKNITIPLLVAGVLSVIAGLYSLLKGRTGRTVLALIIGGAALASAGGPLAIKSMAGKVPAIHDITTDTDNPPVFVDIVALRSSASNPPEYDINQMADQLKAYPNVQSMLLAEPSDKIFAAAVAVLRDMKLDIVTADQEQGRIEATHTSTWFGFKDDVVVRLEPAPENMVIVDMRSKSRVGRSDLGMNAKRILTFQEKLKVALSGA